MAAWCYAACREKGYIKLAITTTKYHINFVKSTNRNFCSAFSYPAGTVHVKAENKEKKKKKKKNESFMCSTGSCCVPVCNFK